MLKQLLENIVLYFKPQWLKDVIVELVDSLAIPSISLPIEQRGLVAEYICEKRNECLFLMNVLIMTLQYHNKGKADTKDADFVLKTLFGDEGKNELYQAFAYHGKNEDALHASREKAIAYALAMQGNYEKLRKMKDFNESVVMGSQIATRFSVEIKNGHDELAFIGLGNRALTLIFMSDEFSKWMEAKFTLKRLSKYMSGIEK
jgi:hypothetical protein